MSFIEALEFMSKGRQVKLPERNFSLCFITKLYYDGDENRPVELIPSSDILRTDWEII